MDSKWLRKPTQRWAEKKKLWERWSSGILMCQKPVNRIVPIVSNPNCSWVSSSMIKIRHLQIISIRLAEELICQVFTLSSWGNFILYGTSLVSPSGPPCNIWNMANLSDHKHLSQVLPFKIQTTGSPVFPRNKHPNNPLSQHFLSIFRWKIPSFPSFPSTSLASFKARSVSTACWGVGASAWMTPGHQGIWWWSMIISNQC